MDTGHRRATLVSLIEEMVREIEGCPGRRDRLCACKESLSSLESLVRNPVPGRALEVLDGLIRVESTARGNEPACRPIYLAGHAMGLAALLSEN